MFGRRGREICIRIPRRSHLPLLQQYPAVGDSDRFDPHGTERGPCGQRHGQAHGQARGLRGNQRSRRHQCDYRYCHRLRGQHSPGVHYRAGTYGSAGQRFLPGGGHYRRGGVFCEVQLPGQECERHSPDFQRGFSYRQHRPQGARADRHTHRRSECDSGQVSIPCGSQYAHL